MNKYGNRKTWVGDQCFDSKREANRWVELVLMQKAGEIRNLERQVPYELIPEVRDETTGKVIQRNIVYKADFVYQDRDGSLVVEDAKGCRTKEYLIKKKLMLWRNGIRIREV